MPTNRAHLLGEWIPARGHYN